MLPKITAYLQHVPQWAYLPGRSTGDALEAVCSHLAQARTLARDSSASLLQRFEGHTPPSISGGISVSLDIHKAFDSLPHTFLTQAMTDASFDPCEIDLILHLHHQAVLCFGVGSECSSTSQVVMGLGIRQGCSLSPLLWSLITGLIYRQFQTALALQNLPEGTTTLFADDVFGSWLFQTPTTFRKAIRAVGVLIDVIQKAGLKLSMDKTVILLLAQGTSASSILSGIRRLIDKIPHLLVPIGRVRTPLKLVQEHKYLGALLSYHNFELTNLRHRLSVMWGAYWRLQHILRSGALGLSMRTAIWRICVFSVMRYSLCHVGIPTGGHNLIRQAVHRQLRLIAKSPAHLWHVTSAQILERLRVEDPWATLCREAQTRSPRPALLLQLPGVLSRLDTLQNQFQHPAPQPVPGDVATTTPAEASPRSEDRSAHAERTVRCPHCQQSFTSLAAMRVHATVQHNRHETSHSELEPTSVSPTVEITGQHVTTLPTSPQQLLLTPLDNSDHHMRRCVQAFADADFLHTGLPADLLLADPQTRFAWLHGTNGLCVCRHCNRRCQTWDDLKVHIFTRSCVMLFPDAMNPSLTHLPVANRLPLLWQLVATDLSHLNWESIARVVQPQIVDMKKRCPICDQWLIQSRGLGHHVKAFHPWAHPALQHAYLLMQTSRRGLALSTPCRYCRTSFTGHEAKHAGECSAILLSRFLSILLLPGAQDHEHGLRGSIEGGDPGGRGRAHIPSDISSERSSLWRYFQPASGRCPP